VFRSLLRALTAVLVLAGVLVAGVVVSSALEPTGSAAWQDPAIIPSVTCVDRLNDTQFRAHFEYENTTGSVVNIPGSPYNFLQIDNSTPVNSTFTAFQPGAGNHAFDIVVAAFVTWTVIDNNSREVSVTATIENDECAGQHPTTTTTEAPTTTTTTVAPTTTTVAPTTTTQEHPLTTTTSCEPYVCSD